MKIARNGSLKYFAFMLPMVILLYNCDLLAVEGQDTLSLGASLRGNQTIISKNGTFELGFFSPNGTNNWYIGIWYAQIPEKTIAWVANRESPVRKIPGFLNLSKDGHLGLFDAEGAIIWSVKSTKKASRAIILDSGNFVLVGANNLSETVWQSFDNPVDTWLPGMKIGRRHKFISWKTSFDPAPGIFSYQMDPSGKIQFVLKSNNSVQYWTSGFWDGQIFSNLPEMASKYLYNFTMENSSSGLYFTHTVTPIGLDVLLRFVLHKVGEIRLYISFDRKQWELFWSQPRDRCDVYGLCGAYGTCDSNNLQSCSCPPGFNPKDNRAWDSQDWWLSGCVRQSPLQCSATNGTTDGFLQLNGKSLPNEQAVTITNEQTPQECRTACLDNCSCAAFAITFSTPPICRLWFGELLNMRDSPDGLSLFLRLAASELMAEKRSRVPSLSILIAAGVAFTSLLALLFVMFMCWMRRQRLQKRGREDYDVPTSLRIFTYRELQIATKNFRHMLGSGAFGSVFKGTLPDNTLVAVKRLACSAQAEKQFRAEISTIGSIQHVNLVRLWGFCAEGSQRLLVYEYMPKGSLNSLLFGKSEEERKMLDWKTRFKMTLGIARGLVYLHEECRYRIIHCDIKPENVLVDENLCPKIADFGLAKLVGRELSHVVTTARGTRGYLAPEWISGLPITPKADVYSFGMTLLEIISGRRSLDLSLQETSRVYFPTWAATQVEKGNILGMVDASIADNADIEEVRRVAVVGGLCIQEDENVRPSMSEVVKILEGRMQAPPPQILRSLRLLLDQGGDEDVDSLVSNLISQW